jgi:hypothetical protein
MGKINIYLIAIWLKYLIKDLCRNVGKTSMLLSYSTGAFSKDYTPTVFDNYTKSVMHNGRLINLSNIIYCY